MSGSAYSKSRLIRRALTLLISLWVFPCWASASPAIDKLKCEKCNLIVINLDFLRSNYIGLIDNSDLTENIDDFFESGIIFENAYATAGSTFRGNVSVFSTTDPAYFAIDVESFTQLKRLRPNYHWMSLFKAPMSIAQILQDAGYTTVGLNQGVRSGRYTGLDRGFEQYRDFPLRMLIEDLIPVTKDSIENAKTPMYIHLHAVPTRLHSAFYPRDRLRENSQDIIYKPYRFMGRDYGYIVIARYNANKKRRREAEHMIYRQQLKYADDVLNRLFKFLNPMLENSIVVLLSTHATQIGDNGIFASNGTGHQMNIRVPLMILHPGITSSTRISTPVSTLDLVPTLLEMLGVHSPEGDGISLLPLITGGHYSRPYIWGKNDHDDFVLKDSWKLIRKFKYERTLTRTDVQESSRNLYRTYKKIAQELEFQYQPGPVESRIISKPPWKLEIRETVTHHLFDIDSDPMESSNLAGRHPEIVTELAEILMQQRQRAAVTIRNNLERLH